MRFKQTLSRKLAAALSAVMILSTIAPTSVPVLAAAPDDVLVDSNVEYDLQDAGSEVLAESAESSLVDESIAPEVAADELLVEDNETVTINEEPLSEENELLVEETGSEPVDVLTDEAPVTEVAETASTVSTGNVVFNVTSANIIKTVDPRYYNFTTLSNTNLITVSSDKSAKDYTVGVISVNTSEGYRDLADGGYAEVALALTTEANSKYHGKYTLSVNGVKADNGDGTQKTVSVDLIDFVNKGKINVIAKRTAYDGKAPVTAVSGNTVSGKVVPAIKSFRYSYEDGSGSPQGGIVTISGNGQLKIGDEVITALPFENTNEILLNIVAADYAAGVDAAHADITINGKKFEDGEPMAFKVVPDANGNGVLEVGDLAIVAAKNTNDAYVSFATSTSENIISGFRYTFSRVGDPSTGYDPKLGTFSFAAGDKLIFGGEEKSTISCDEVNKITIDQITVKSGNPDFTYAIKVNGKYVLANSATAFAPLEKSIEIPIKAAYTADSPLNVKIEAVPFKKVTVSANDAEGKANFESTPFWYQVRGGAYSFRDAAASWTGTYWSEFYVEPNTSVSLNTMTLATGKEFLNPVIKKADGTVIVPTEPESEGVYVWSLDKITDDTTFYIDAKAYKLFDEVELSLAKDQSSYPIVSFNNALDDTTNHTFSGAINTLGAGKVSENVVFDYSQSATELQITLKTDNEFSRGQDKYKYDVDSIYYIDYDGKKVVLGASASGDYFEKSGDLTIVHIPKNKVKDLLYNGEKLKLVITQKRSTAYANVTLTSSPSKKINATMTYETTTANNRKVEIKEGEPSATNTPNTLYYDEKVKIKATPAEGFKLTSVSFNEIKGGLPTSLSSNVSSAADIEKILAGTYEYKIPYKDLRVTFNVEEDYHLHVGYQEKTGSSASLTVEQDKKGNYKVMSNRPVEIKYFKGENQPDFTYDVLLGKTSILNKVSENGVKKVTKSGKTYLVLNGLDKELAGKTVTVKMTGTATGSKTLEAVFIIDKDNSRGLSFAASDKKNGVTMNMGASQVLKLTPKGVLSANVTLSNSSVPAGFEAELSADYRTLKITTKAAIVKSYKEPLIVNLKDAYTGEIYDSIVVTLKDSIKDSEKPTVNVTAATNNTVTVSLKTAKGIDTSLDGLYYQLTTTVTGTKTGTPLKTTPIVEFVKISDKTHRIDLLKDGADDATKADGDPDATITVKVKVVQVDGDALVANIVSAGTEESKDGHPAKGGVFETNLRLKKAASPINGYYSNVRQKDAYVFDVVWSKKTTVQKLESAVIYDEAGNDINMAGTYYDGSSDTTIKFWTISAGTELVPGTYTIEAKALEVNGKEVKATMKVKVKPAIENLRLTRGNPTLIYKTGNKAATAKLIAEGYSYNTKEKGYEWAKTSKVEWSIVKQAGGLDDSEPDFVANKMITIGKRNGTIKINKNFKVDNTKFYVKIKAVDYKGNYIDAYSNEITVKTKYASELKLAIDPNNGFGTFEELPSSGLVKDLFNENYNWDKGNYKYYTYVSAFQKAEDGTNSFVPATYKVSGAKLIETLNRNGRTVAKIGFTKFGDVKITVTTTDGSNRSLKGNKAAKVTVNPYNGKLGYMLFDNADNVGNINPNNPADVAKVTAWNVSTDSIKGQQVITTASESSKTVDNYQPAGQELTLIVKAYGKSGNAGVASAADHSISVKGAKLIKQTGIYGQYKLVPSADKTIVTLTNKTAKTPKFTLTINNKAIDNKDSKGKGLKKVTFNTKAKMNYSATAKDGNGKGIIYNDILFTKANTDKGWAFYDSASFNRVTYTLKDNYGDAQYVLVNVLKEDTTIDIYDADEAENYHPINYAVNAAAKKDVHDGAGNAIKKDGSYLVKLTSTNGIKTFTIDYAGLYDTDADTKADMAYYSIKAGTYKIGVTPVKVAQDSKGKDYALTDLKFIATGKETVLNVKAVKTPKATVRPKAVVKWADKKTNAIDDGKYKNIIKRANADKKQSAGGIQYDTAGLKGVNKAGIINNFKTYFTVDETGKLTFRGKAKDAKSEAVDTLDPKKDKDELKGWTSFKYQDFSGRVKDGDVKVTLSVPKGGSITTK